MQSKKKILLIICGSIAAYKSLELIRILKKNKYEVKCVLTKAGSKFVTPLSITSLCGNVIYDDLFSLKDHGYMEHISLSREADLVVVAPASADIIGKMACGLADDLASTILLANDKDILVAPAMNYKMWENKSVVRNVKMLKDDGVNFIGPAKGKLACGEEGDGKMVEVDEIFVSLKKILGNV